MRSLIILLLTYLVLCKGQECQEHVNAKRGCYPDPHICKIECVKDEAKCTREGDLCDEALVTDDSLSTLTAMDAELCTNTCSLSTDVEDIAHRCRFWRWALVGYTKTCILMSEAQCTDFDQCSGEHCKCGDNGCQGGADPAPTLASCKGPIKYEEDHIHWNCNGLDGGHLGAYSPGDMEHGTTCATIQKCADWAPQSEEVNLANTLKVKCNNGKWEADDGGDVDVYTAVLGAGNEAIKEQACSGGNNKLMLTVAKIDQPGAALSCQSPLDPPAEGFYIIAAPNSCVLLCDFQLGWTLESFLNEEGVGRFKCETCDNEEFPVTEDNIQDGSMVECWPARKH